jgi:hypothetical protein
LPWWPERKENEIEGNDKGGALSFSFPRYDGERMPVAISSSRQ